MAIGNGADTGQGGPALGFAPPEQPPATFDYKSDIPRTRFRRQRISFENKTIFDRVKKFHDDDLIDHNEDRDRRIQREAKFRMWSEGKSWPWENSSDIAFPDIMEKCLRVQDTLHNAAMSQSPLINVNANNPADKEKQRKVEQLLMTQFFNENLGEQIIGDIADAFVNEGTVVVYTPWVKEDRDIVDIRRFEAIPAEQSPDQYFQSVLQQIFGPQAEITPRSAGQYWDWKVTYDKKDGDQGEAACAFYTAEDGSSEVNIKTETRVFDGPRPMVLDDDEMLAPPRCANLQPPSPSNPKGAAHCIMKMPIDVDQIRRHIKSRYYDSVDATEENLEKIGNLSRDDSEEEPKQARDQFQGTSQNKPAEERSHRDLTLLVCYDLWDADSDGINEDVVWWVVLEAELVVRARFLTEVCPLNPPRRPFSEGQFTPVRSRRKGIGLIEMLESMHDTAKKTMDQAIDANDLAINPFFFYRKTAAVTPNVIRLWPGEGYPVSDPQRDIMFPQVGNPQAMGFALNLFGLLMSAEERVAVIGAMQFGQVPAGKSAALRTAGGMSLLQAQGEARPERILRRFFMVLTDIFRTMHGLDRVMLPKNKQFLILGPLETGEDPYQDITDKAEIGGSYQFTFKANVLNTSRDVLAESLKELMAAFVNPLTMQMGMVKPEGIYRLFRDYATARGQEVENYLEKPTQGSDKPKITAMDVIHSIMTGVEPDGIPAEGIQEQYNALEAWHQSDNFGLLSPIQVDMYRSYLMKLNEAFKQEQQQMQQQQAAQQFQQAMQQGQPQTGGAPTTKGPPSLANPQISGPAELMDETLSTAGGGGAKA